MRRVQLWVWVGRVPVPAPPAAEHHVAAGHRALVHLAQVDSTEVDLQGALVTESLQADITLNPLLPCCRVDKRGSKILVEGCILSCWVNSLWTPAHHLTTRLLARSIMFRLVTSAKVHWVEKMLLLAFSLLFVEFRHLMLVGRHARVEAEGGRNWVSGWQSRLVERSHRADRRGQRLLHWRPWDLWRPTV